MEIVTYTLMTLLPCGAVGWFGSRYFVTKRERKIGGIRYALVD